jgi:hypothetical protein
MGAIDADVPYILNDLADRFRRKGTSFPMDALAANNMWVACENTDDLPYVLSHAGEDRLMIGRTTVTMIHQPSSMPFICCVTISGLHPPRSRKFSRQTRETFTASMTGEIALKLRLSDTLEERIFPMHVTSKPRII